MKKNELILYTSPRERWEEYLPLPPRERKWEDCDKFTWYEKASFGFVGGIALLGTVIYFFKICIIP